ncbi:hypothetical protein KKG45_08825 [bacterium]|nr:hypothetical protein [bacterium]MBU1073337.1 hypothetical protein [bacterium]MBU1676452.1 hypothetical protein [bacterium]
MTTEHSATSYECVDPNVGEEIWRLDIPNLDAVLRRELEAHVLVCHACRLHRDLDACARRLVRDGEIDLGATPAAASWSSGLARAAGIAATLAIVASLVGVLFLPPRPVGADMAVRGEVEARFTRPVEGQVVPAGACCLSWTEVPGATRYEVRITDRDGDFTWTGTTDRNRIDLPEDAGLTEGAAYKAVLSARPVDLLPPGRTSVAFRSGTSFEVAAHRLRWAQRWIHGLGLAGLFLLALAVVRWRE